MTFLMIVVYLVAGVLFGIEGHMIKNALVTRRKMGITQKELNALSWPSKTILKEYAELDSEYRPTPIDQLYRSLVAMDKKHGKHESTNAFTKVTWDYEGTSRSTGWNHPQSGHIAKEFLGIRRDIQGMKNALAERERAIMLAGIDSDLSAITSFREELQAHANIVREVTGELS